MKKCTEFSFKESYSQLPGNLSQDYKYLHASQNPHNKAFPPKPYLTV